VRSAIDLAWHIVASETRFLEAVASGAFDFSGAARPESIRTPADVVDWYSERFAKDTERLKQITGDQLMKIVDFRGLFQFPAVVYVQLGLKHSGESYDAREAREKAQAASG
jgi:hypothetical protein